VKNESENKMTRYQDDFYDAINGEWEKTAVIPADKSRTGGFIDLDEEIEELMLATTDKWLAGEDVPEDAILANFVKYHRMVRDFDKREADGIKPVLPLLKEYQDLESFADFTSKLAEFELAGKPNFLPFGVSPDFMDARTNVLWASAPGTILPDTTYYAEDHPQREELLTLWKESTTNLLKAYDVVSQQWFFQTKKVQNMPNSTIHTLMKNSKNLLLPYLWMTSSKLFLGKFLTRLS